MDLCKLKSINIFGVKYDVIFCEVIKDQDCEEGHFIEGWCKSAERKIIVATKDKNGKNLDDNKIRIVFLHELTHAILAEGQYIRETDDEPLVEWLARCMNDLLVKQNVGKMLYDNK